MTDKRSKDQAKINKAQQAEGLKNNQLLAEIFVALKAGYFERLVSTSKGEGYLEELASIHESMQNLGRIEGYINRCIVEGKVIVNNNNRPDIQ